VPVVFVSYHGRYYIPIDEKTKKVKSKKLKRVENIKTNPNVALLIDNYEENWKKLLYVMVRGTAFLLNERQDIELLNKIHKLLYTKYPQYRYLGIGKTCIAICPQRVVFWKNS
jgi:PPOX class probable F420-dependent enzyme